MPCERSITSRPYLNPIGPREYGVPRAKVGTRLKTHPTTRRPAPSNASDDAAHDTDEDGGHHGRIAGSQIRKASTCQPGRYLGSQGETNRGKRRRDEKAPKSPVEVGMSGSGTEAIEELEGNKARQQQPEGIRDR